jgi:predicted ester cyclase
MAHTTAENKSIVLRFNEECLVKANLQALDEIVDPRFINYTAPAGFANDKESLKTFILNGLSNIGDLKLEIHDMIAEGNKVVTHKTFTGILKAPFMGKTAIGQPISMRIIDIIELENGRYINHRSIREVLQ